MVQGRAQETARIALIVALEINLKGCYILGFKGGTVICRPLELVTNIQESPMKGKHL